MDTMHTSRADLSYSDQPPILIGSTSDFARSRAVQTIEAFGWRVADAVPIEAAAERIARQISTKAVWLELDRDCGEAMDALLRQVSADAAAGRYSAVVSGTAELLDPILAKVDESAIEEFEPEELQHVG